MTQEKIEFMSKYRSPIVSHPPSRFGYGVNLEGEQAPYPCSEFDDYKYDSVSEKEIGFLRDSIHNEANGGDVFWEVGKDTVQTVDAINGKVTVGLDNKVKLNQNEKQALDFLDACTQKIEPKDRSTVLAMYNDLIERFKLAGCMPMGANSSDREIKSMLNKALEAIELYGVWKGK